MPDRALLLSHARTRGLRGFEVGALTSPFLPKPDNDVTLVDRLSTAELRARYAGESNVDVDQIAEVDVVVPEGASLVEAMRDLGPFDYAIASHVIEHVPDIAGWLAEVAELVRVGGQLVLVVPDKRFTFDYLRDLSSTSDVVDAFVQRRVRPSPGQVFDYNAHAADVDPEVAWSTRLDPKALRRFGDAASAFELAARSHREGRYVDSHCWVVTPRRFLEVCGDLAELGILRWKLALFADSRRNDRDFAMVLERVSDAEPREHVAQTFRRAFGDAADHAGALDEEVARLRSEVRALRSSTSWQLTQPARWLSRMLQGGGRTSRGHCEKPLGDEATRGNGRNWSAGLLRRKRSPQRR